MGIFEKGFGMRPIWLVSVVSLALIASGCANGKDKANGEGRLSDKGSDAQSAEHARFETVQDPPISADTRYAAGELAESQGNPQRAVEQYTEALKINPNHLPAMFRLWTLYAQLKMFPQAIDMWQRYVTKTNGSAAAYSNLGYCYQLAGNNAEAETAYKKGISKDATEQSCRVNYGLMLASLGRANEIGRASCRE